MIKAIIFDFDGVLVLSELPRFQSLQRITKDFGIHIQDSDFKKIIGRTTRNFLNDFVTTADKEVIIDKILSEHERMYQANITEYVGPVSHSVEFIRNYNGSVLFAIGSMGRKNTINLFIKHFGIEDKFKAVLSKEDVINHKPDPEVYLKAVDKLAVHKDECIIIEDTIIGAQAAINAGIPCYIILNGENNEEDFDGMPIAGFISSQEDFEKLV